MRVIKPISVTPAKLTATSIPEPDTARGEVAWTAGTYTTGTRRILTSTHLVYQVVADPSTTDSPAVGAAKPVPTWVVVGPTNRYAMFDDVNDTQSIGDSPLNIEITPSQVVNGLAMFNVSGAPTINVKQVDPVEGIVYDRDVAMTDNSSIVDYYAYCFEPIINRTEFVLLDLQPYATAKVVVSAEGGEIAVGTLTMGTQIDLGIALYGTSLQLLDFSRKERNEFGNFEIVPRRTAKLVDFDVSVPKGRVGYVFNQLQALTTVPAVWVGTDENDDSTLVYGYYRDSQINISGPVYCSATIQIEGLT
jgi:hypothetical protein